MKQAQFSPQEMYRFLEELSQNNTKVWFDEHRDRYTEIRKKFVDFTVGIHADMVSLDPNLVHMDPKKSLFRINRDVRFSKDKTPYKTHMGSKFSCTGQKKGVAGYGFGVSADGRLYVMGGINKIETPKLNLLRDNLVERDSELLSLFLSKKFIQEFNLSDLGFGKLKTIPRGYPKDFRHPELLQLQAFWAMHWIDLSDIPNDGEEESLEVYILNKLSLLVPMVNTINSILQPQNKTV